MSNGCTPIPGLSRSFSYLNAAQFLGAMNDNILKLLIIFCLISAGGAGKAGIITASVGAAFVLPFLLFSAPAGCLADRLSKSRISVMVKVMEVVVTALAVLVFAFEWHNGLYAVIFLMATHSAFFAPAKYGVIPELAGNEQLSRANGLIESFTYLAIIFGTTLASALAQFSLGRYWVTGIFCLLVAIAGLWAASRVGETPRADPQRQIAWFPAEILRTILELRTDRDILFAITGQAYFMFVGAYTQLNLIGYGIQEIGLVESRSGYLFLAAALGIGIGSIAAARISGRDVETGLVPVGAIGLVLALFLLQAVQPGLISCIVIVVILGISAGIFSLPLQTYIQLRANPLKRGEVLAAASFVNWVAILVASMFTWLFSGPMGLRPAQGFGAVGAVTLVFSLIFFWWMPGLRQHFFALVSRSGGGH